MRRRGPAPGRLAVAPAPSPAAPSPDARRPVLPVDPLDDGGDVLEQLGDVPAEHAPRRVRDLDQRQAPAPLRVRVEHALHGQHLELDALERVEVVDAQQHRLPLERGRELAAAPRRVRPGDRREEPLGLDAGRHDLEPDGPAVVLEHDAPAAVDVLQAQHARAAREKVARVVEGVEADEVRVEHRPQDLFAARERAEDLGGGERRVQRQAEADAVQALAQQRGQHEQVVVVDPDEVARDVADGRDDDVGEGLVRLHVAAPEVGVEPPGARRREGHQVVQQRPELLLAEAAVVPLAQLRSQEDGAAAERREELEGHRLLLGGGDVVRGEAADVEHVDVVADALLRESLGFFFLVSGKEERVSEKRERGGKVEVEVSKKSKERAREAPKKKKTHRSLRDQRVLVPLELPLARGRGALHLDGQVVGDEDEAVGVVVCVGKGKRERER